MLLVCSCPVHLSHATNTKELPSRERAEPGSSVSHRPGKHIGARVSLIGEPLPLSSLPSGLCHSSGIHSCDAPDSILPKVTLGEGLALLPVIVCSCAAL